MKKFSLMAVVLSLGLALATADAEAARRLGGGKSTGMQRQSTATQTAPSTPAQAPAAPMTSAAAKAPAAAPAAAAAAAPAKRSWLGPIAGLAAGLGLAALASHLGFGQELANMLMIGLLVMAVVAVIGFVMRRRSGGMQPATAAAGAGAGAAGFGSEAEAQPMARSYEVARPAAGGSMIGSGIGAGLAPAAAAIPADFDTAAFVRQAKVQFIRLQAANDSGNLDDIREFTTPEMFAEIQLDLQDRHGASQVTEVVRVDAEVLEVAEEGPSYVVSVRFSGEIREDKGAPAEAFAELWHLTKPRQGDGGWVLAGIQQLH